MERRITCPLRGRPDIKAVEIDPMPVAVADLGFLAEFGDAPLRCLPFVEHCQLALRLFVAELGFLECEFELFPLDLRLHGDGLDILLRLFEDRLRHPHLLLHGFAAGVLPGAEAAHVEFGLRNHRFDVVQVILHALAVDLGHDVAFLAMPAVGREVDEHESAIVAVRRLHDRREDVREIARRHRPGDPERLL